MKYSEVRAVLQGLGQEIGHYHQESERAKAPTQLRGHMSKGFCAGASLDWLRTVMNGGNAASGPDVMTAGIAFVKQTPTARNEFYASFNKNLSTAKASSLENANRRITAMNQRAPDVIEQKVKQLADQKMRERLPGITQNEMDAIVDEVQAAVERNKQRIEAEHASKFAGISTDAKFRAFWLEFGRTMDEKLATKFGEYRYSNLTIARSSPDRQYGPPNGVLEVIVKILAEPSFSPLNGVLLGLCPGSGSGAGHGIAIHRLNSGDYHMFDPNFGTYKLDQLNLKKAFCWLFLKAYPTMEDGTHDNKAYEIDGKVSAEYLIYARRQ
jgi:hypothetical protein